VSFRCAVVAHDIAVIRGDLFPIVGLSTVFAFSVGSMVLATIDVGRKGIAGGSSQSEVGASVVLQRARTVSCLTRVVLMELSVCTSIARFLRMSTIFVNCSERVEKTRMIRYYSVTSSGVPSSS